MIMILALYHSPLIDDEHDDLQDEMITMMMCKLHQYVPQKAVAEVSKIANYRRLVAVNHGSQSEPTDGLTSGWRQRSGDVIVVEMYL